MSHKTVPTARTTPYLARSILFDAPALAEHPVSSKMLRRIWSWRHRDTRGRQITTDFRATDLGRNAAAATVVTAEITGFYWCCGRHRGVGGNRREDSPSFLRFETSYSKQAQRTVYDLSLRHLLLNSSACKLRDSYRVTTVDSEQNVPNNNCLVFWPNFKRSRKNAARLLEHRRGNEQWFVISPE